MQNCSAHLRPRDLIAAYRHFHIVISCVEAYSSGAGQIVDAALGMIPMMSAVAATSTFLLVVVLCLFASTQGADRDCDLHRVGSADSSQWPSSFTWSRLNPDNRQRLLGELTVTGVLTPRWFC